jgi:phosphoglycerate dehydrogenase-like enzyme
MNARVLVTLALPPAEQEFLKMQLPDSELRFRSGSDVSDDDLDWATVVFGNIKPPERLIPRKNLRWLHTPNVGLDGYVFLSKERPDLRLSRSQGVNDHAVAEHALAMLMFLTRGLHVLAAAQAQQQWGRAAYMAHGMTVLAGKVAHVLGYGGIGRCLVDKLLGLGMQVCVYRREGHGDNPRVKRYLPFGALLSEVASTDVLFGVLPDHPATRRLVNERVLDAMKRTAYIVNVGRGSVLDETALAGALSAGRCQRESLRAPLSTCSRPNRCRRGRRCGKCPTC